MNVNVKIIADTATPDMQTAYRQFSNRAPLFDAMGRRIVRDTSRHVRNWGLTHPNKLGGRRTNYWATQSAKINPADVLAVDSSGATMTLDGGRMPGILRAFGDVVITAGTKTAGVKYLALPARSESYGMKPRELPGLVLFWRGKGQPGGLSEGVPMTRTKNTVRGAKGSTYFAPGLVMYWFKKSVTQSQDRTLLPGEDDWTQSANAAAKEWKDIQLSKGGGK